MQYRIIKKNGTFYPQYKRWFRWKYYFKYDWDLGWTVHVWHFTLDEAVAFVEKMRQPKPPEFVVVKVWGDKE